MVSKSEEKIYKRIRSKVKGIATKPDRLAIYRSNKEIYAQLIDDIAGKTIVLLHHNISM